AWVSAFGGRPGSNAPSPRLNRVEDPTDTVTFASPMAGWIVSVLAAMSAAATTPSANLNGAGAVPAARAETAAPARVSVPMQAALTRSSFKVECTFLQLLSTEPCDERLPRLPVWPEGGYPPEVGIRLCGPVSPVSLPQCVSCIDRGGGARARGSRGARCKNRAIAELPLSRPRGD